MPELQLPLPLRDTPCPLTPRELAVLRSAASGHCSKQTSQSLAMAPQTVKVHLQKIHAKLGLKGAGSTTGAVAKALRMGWME